MMTTMTSERRASRGQDRQELSRGEAGSARERGKVSTKYTFLFFLKRWWFVDILKGKVKRFIFQILLLLIFFSAILRYTLQKQDIRQTWKTLVLNSFWRSTALL